MEYSNLHLRINEILEEKDIGKNKIFKVVCNPSSKQLKQQKVFLGLSVNTNF